MTNPVHALSTHDTLRIAVAAMVTPRTVSRHLAGGRSHLLTATATNRALTELGFGHLVPGAPKTPEVSPAG